MSARPAQSILGAFSATVLLILASAPQLCGKETEAEALHAFVDRGVRDWSLTGLAVAVVKDGKVVFSRGYGVRDVRGKEPVDEHTVFQIGSASKPLTVSGIALLVQDGKIGWDTPVVEKWPGFSVADRVVTQQATLRDMLSHRTGVGKDESVLYYGMPIARDDLLMRLPELAQAAPFRTEWQYSNLMYSAAGCVTEQITGELWDQWMAKRLFQPLGMERTFTSRASFASVKNVAVPHVRADERTSPTPFADQDNIKPAAALSSSVSDLSRWLLMITGGGRYQGRQILQPELVLEMVKPHILMPHADPVHGKHQFNAYGLGWMLCDYHGRRLAKHPGMAGHSLAIVGFVPEERVGAVVLTNHRPGLFHYAVFRRAIDLYCGLPPIDLDSANKKLLAEHRARQEQSQRRSAEARDASKKPTLPLSGYAGVYEGKYGLLATVHKEAENLVIRYGNFVADATHWQADTFRARVRERRLPGEQDWHLTFSVENGLVSKLHIDSEHDVYGDFTRVTESNHRPGLGEDVSGSSAPAAATKPETELRRRSLFGAQLAEVSSEVRNRQKLEGDGGVVLEKVFPDTSAAESDFKVGDVILAVGGTKVTGVAMFLEKIAGTRAGDVIALETVRDGVRIEKSVKLKEMPRERGEGYEVIYSFVTSHGARLRTIITRPKRHGRHPAVMFLQGGTACFSVESPVGTPAGFIWVAQNVARRGYVTMRIERPGCADSEGGPLRDVDFDTELDGLKQGLRALKQLDFVDPENVFLFGHSMGGVVAPLMAVEIPVRGIATFGTASGTWFESVFGQRRRLVTLDGTDAAEADREILRQARFWYSLLVDRKTPREIRERYPELAKLGWIKDDVYVGDRHYKYHFQVADKNLAETWTKVASTNLSGAGASGPAGASVHPRVLAIWGTTDWLSTESQHTWIVDVVNRVGPGTATFAALDSIDHFFLRTATQQESYRYFKPVKGIPPTEFNRVIIETLVRWLDESTIKAAKEAGK